MLPLDEWLADAQRLPIGGVNRVYHGAEHRRNLVVYNKPDRWEAWCHACNEGGVLFKTHVRAVDEPPPPILQSVPSVLTAPDIPDVIKHLQSKGVSLPVLREFKPQYSPIDKRLVLSSGGMVLGRDITGRSPAKWYNYTNHLVFKAGSSGIIFLTEDVYSAIKIYYTSRRLGVSVQAWAILGTRVHAALRTSLVQAGHPVVRWFDADASGRAADTAVHRACRAFGIQTVAAQPPREVDPKMHTYQEIQRVITTAQEALDAIT